MHSASCPPAAKAVEVPAIHDTGQRGSYMPNSRQIGRGSALEPKPGSNAPHQRRQLHATPMVRRRLPIAPGVDIPRLDRSVTEQLLDEEFDELRCELSTLLRIATQL